MANVISSQLTALTASILFDGQKIGELQELIVQEEFNTKPIESIGSNFILDFLPGTTTGRILAKKALLESDLFFDRLTPGLSSSTGLSGIVKDISGNRIDISTELKTIEGISDFWNTIFSNKSINDRYNFVLYFDIELINQNNVVFAKFDRCCIKSRSLSVTLGNVVIMQDIVILFQKRSI